MSDAKEKNRLENIMQIDTTSLLKELKSLEHSLSEYQRQDAVPSWASSILPRLEFLEKSSDGARDRVVRETVSDLDQLDADDVLMEKIRREVEARTMALKLAFDAKTSASALEIDRLHKLLYIRPTTSELQEVVHSVRQVAKRTDSIVGELGEEIQGLVSLKLTEEMSSLMDRLKAAEEHSDRAVEVVVVRVDEIENEVRKVRTSVKSEFDFKDKLLETLKTDSLVLQEDTVKLRNSVKKLGEETRASLHDLSMTQTAAQEQFTEYETATNERVEIIEENITACDEMIREEVGKADQRYEELSGAIAGLTEAFGEFKTSYAADMERMQATSDAISELLNKTVERQNTIMHFMESLQQFEVTAKITKNAESIDSIRRENELMEESINVVRLSVVEVKKELNATNEELSEVPAKINLETLKIEANQKEIGQVKESLKYTKTMIQDQQNQLEDLSLLKEQMVMVKDVCETQDDRIKKILRNIGEVMENSESQDKRIDEVVQGIELSEERMMAKIANTKRLIDENVSQQHAEVEAKVQVLKDNVAICMAGMGGGAKKMGTIAMPTTTKESISRQDSAERVLAMVESFDESRPTSAPPNAVLNSSAEKIEIIADMCSNFEEISHLRNNVPQILPSVMCNDLASVCQSLAQILAETADLEVLQRNIKGDPASIGYEDPVTDKRSTLVDTVMIDLRNKLYELDPNAGAVKLEARDLFMTRFYNALQLALSRHDQILATGNTRLGRLKIPACIACDRPLVSKVSRDSVSGVPGRAKTPLGLHGGPSWSSQTAPYTTGGNYPIGASMSTTAGGHLLSRASSFGNDMDKMGGTGGNLLENSIDDGSYRGKSVRLPATFDDRDDNKRIMSKSQDFVLRAGFKMPKPGQYQPPASAEGRVQLPQMPHH